MRIDVGVWTKKRLLAVPNTSKELPSPQGYESHWLRFEKFMGSKGYLGITSEHRSFLLTDFDYLMEGNTFYKHD